MNQLNSVPRQSEPTPSGYGCVPHSHVNHLPWQTGGDSFRGGGETFLAALLAIVLVGLLAIAIGGLAAVAWDQPEPMTSLYDVGNPPAEHAGTSCLKMSSQLDKRIRNQRKTHNSATKTQTERNQKQ
jgi:hypothetical protein